MKKSQKNIKLISSYYGEIFLAILLFIVLLYFGALLAPDIIKDAFKINEYQDFPEEPYHYRFYVASNKDILDPLNYAYIKQDFFSNEGEVSFGTGTPSKKIDWALLNLPSKTDANLVRCYTQQEDDYVKSVLLTNKPYNEPTEYPCLVKQNDNSSLTINFGGLEFENMRFIITYPLTIKPNNEYKIIHDSRWSGSGLTGNFILYFGEAYDCISECVFDHKNVENSFQYSSVKEKHILFNDEYPNTEHSFKVITKSRKLLDDKNFNLAMGISMGVGAIFGLISVAIYFFQVLNQMMRHNLNQSEILKMEDRIVKRIKSTIHKKRNK